jgi:hypothetical protein
MSHSLEKEAGSSATAANVEDPARNPEMSAQDSFLHRKEIKSTVLFQRLFAGKGFLVPQFLFGEIHQPLFPVLEVGAILQDLFEFRKSFLGTAPQFANPQLLLCRKADLRSRRQTLDS